MLYNQNGVQPEEMKKKHSYSGGVMGWKKDTQKGVSPTLYWEKNSPGSGRHDQNESQNEPFTLQSGRGGTGRDWCETKDQSKSTSNSPTHVWKKRQVQVIPVKKWTTNTSQGIPTHNNTHNHVQENPLTGVGKLRYARFEANRENNGKI